MADPITTELATAALDYHRLPRPGKLEIQATKPLANQRDLALAYSPGVAAACLAIAGDPSQADAMTIRQNLVAVLSNGTAVLGLGDIGPLASKPVMEGKAVLFKKFAGIDVFDIEVDAKDPKKLIEVVAALEPTFGGINLEDIKAPECFEVERTLRERMKIPVFHDDQHGTAIIVAAAVTNAMAFAGKTLTEAKIVASGAGAAALACLDLLVTLGARHENITVTDIEGVVYKGRAALMDPRKAIYARETRARTLAEVIDGADVFLGLSAGGVLKREMLARMADKPLIMALANPYPEIEPAEALAARPDGDDLHRPLGLPEPGQQRHLLPLHLSRRARRLGLGDQRGDEARRRPCHRRAGAGAALRRRRQGLRRRVAPLRQGQPDPVPVRPALDPSHRARRRQGGDGVGRGAQADREFRRPTRTSSRASCSAPASS